MVRGGEKALHAREHGAFSGLIRRRDVHTNSIHIFGGCRLNCLSAGRRYILVHDLISVGTHMIGNIVGLDIRLSRP